MTTFNRPQQQKREKSTQSQRVASLWWQEGSGGYYLQGRFGDPKATGKGGYASWITFHAYPVSETSMKLVMAFNSRKEDDDAPLPELLEVGVLKLRRGASGEHMVLALPGEKSGFFLFPVKEKRSENDCDFVLSFYRYSDSGGDADAASKLRARFSAQTPANQPRPIGKPQDEEGEVNGSGDIPF
jgi:hypothetical protein